MPTGDSCLLDSNILLRTSKSDDPRHIVTGRALHVLVRQGVRLCYTSQTLGDFWNASTRPLDKNGFGLSVAETDRLARVIERDFECLPDSRDVHDAGGPCLSPMESRVCRFMTPDWQPACMSTASRSC
jgi:hypothetical protein